MKKIFTKKNLKKALTYTAVAIGGAAVTIVACTVYGKKLEDREMLKSDYEDEQIFDTENEEIIETEESEA